MTRLLVKETCNADSTNNKHKQGSKIPFTYYDERVPRSDFCLKSSLQGKTGSLATNAKSLSSNN